jgi:hypothetical protein
MVLALILFGWLVIFETWRRRSAVNIIDGILIWRTPDEGGIQIKTCARTRDKGALMADHHQGYAVSIGGVVAYRDSISPSGAGYDISCGNKTMGLLRLHKSTLTDFLPVLRK